VALPGVWTSVREPQPVALVGRFRLADHFRGRPEGMRVAFDALVRAARANGQVTVYAQKTRARASPASPRSIRTAGNRR
jgi:hypothetical protein